MTCKIVKAPSDIPRIGKLQLLAYSLASRRVRHFDCNYSRDLQHAKQGGGHAKAHRNALLGASLIKL